MIELSLILAKVIGISFVVELTALILTNMFLFLFAKVNWKQSLYDNKSDYKKQVDNGIASNIVASVIIGIHIILGLVILGTYFAV